MTWRETQMALNGHGYQVAVDGMPGPQTYSALFSYMGAQDKAAAFGRAAGEYFPRYGITTPLRVAHFLAQAAPRRAISAGFERYGDRPTLRRATKAARTSATAFPAMVASSLEEASSRLLAATITSGSASCAGKTSPAIPISPSSRRPRFRSRASIGTSVG
jgi:hypothetical protein